jgi:peroxiredoxin
MSFAPGQLPPDVALTDTAGRTVRLGELRGAVVLLVFLRHLT